jgi:hypothetical protein
MAAPSAITIRTSVATDGTQGNQMSGRFSRPAISADASFTAFDSIANTLVPGDTNGASDVFVHDARAGSTERVSVSTSGQQANEDSTNPSIDGDGRLTVWDSTASNLVPNDTNPLADVFVHDRQSGRTVLVSAAVGSGSGNGSSFLASISADGSSVAFVSDASNLVPGDTNDRFDIFVRDLAAGTTVRANVATAGTQGDADSTFPAISGDGGSVAFASDATNLIPNDTNGARRVSPRPGHRSNGARERDRQQRAGERSERGTRGARRPGLGPGDGFRREQDRVRLRGHESGGRRHQHVPASIPGPGQCPDVFVRHVAAGTTTRVSVASNGAQGNDASTDPAMDASGRAVAFFSPASNLVAGDTNQRIQYPTMGHCPDIFVHISR